LLSKIPLLKDFPAQLSTLSLNEIIDSSDASPAFWVTLTKVIVDNYEKYDGFVILHGSDTMAFTASALSFMLENLSKPVILTGSQLPIGLLRTDARENIIAALELACLTRNNNALIQEVCVYFENSLYRGNRTTKYSAENFDAFRSPNYKRLAEVGINIKIYYERMWKNNIDFLVPHYNLCNDIIIVRLFPGISTDYINTITNLPNLKGLILQTFGAGNAPNNKDFLYTLATAIENGIIILNVTQCFIGKVEPELYELGKSLNRIGVISGRDITIEAAVTKLMYLFGQNFSTSEIKKILQISLRGEIT
jgi:L-asparaginase